MRYDCYLKFLKQRYTVPEESTIISTDLWKSVVLEMIISSIIPLPFTQGLNKKNIDEFKILYKKSKIPSQFF